MLNLSQRTYALVPFDSVAKHSALDEFEVGKIAATKEAIVRRMQPHMRKKGRYWVVLEPEETLLLDDETILHQSLVVSSVISAELLEELRNHMECLSALDRALASLARRGFAELELQRRLLQKGLAPRAVTWAIERLRSRGFINDEAYVRAYVRSKLSSGKVGSSRIASELIRRGVARDTVQSVLREFTADENHDEQADCRRLAEKRLAQMKGLETLVVKRRLCGFLARRGFKADIVFRVVDDVLRGK